MDLKYIVYNKNSIMRHVLGVRELLEKFAVLIE